MTYILINHCYSIYKKVSSCSFKIIHVKRYTNKRCVVNDNGTDIIVTQMLSQDLKVKEFFTEKTQEKTFHLEKNMI